MNRPDDPRISAEEIRETQSAMTAFVIALFAGGLMWAMLIGAAIWWLFG